MIYSGLNTSYKINMLITDYMRSEHDLTWDYARQCGINHAVIRLPEDDNFDVVDFTQWKNLHKKYTDFGFKPVIIEPMPNNLHDHIKTGDSMRDECIEKVIKMLEYMDILDIRTICFNWMAHIGWTRTSSSIKERGNALVTGFDLNNFTPTDKKITSDELWDNYEYFIKAIIPYAEKYNIRLALHPDDPPLPKLGDVERIMINYQNIKKAISIIDSPNLGITMCQATFLMMGEDLYDIIPKLADKIFFIHFRNATGDKYKFNETFHDNGRINMPDIIRLYKDCDIDVPIRIDHVPLMSGEHQGIAGYTALGRLYANGYLKGILESI